MNNNNNNNNNNSISNNNNNYVCYIIYKNNYSYVGITNNINKRIRQHNNIIKGGAKYTTSKGSGWNYLCYIKGFKNKIDALMFEWSIKHCAPKNKYGIINRIDKLYKTLNKSYWTKKSPNSINYNLILVWCEFTYIPDNYESLLPPYITQDIDIDIDIKK
jgi:predicted GIY-YIG superfamily endonuclease